ncbi:hypothetical protein KQI18_12800 [Clostridioides mangenotii]|uniref:hypothetical protein n=1 Tax=Metaclostridioides mangenotii TaxID=1540 RepID=UPI001C112B54|nr:hypothetical protein [Clostridioides mangenotii]MBU5308657.1 hypothetical protein [Clostridioides mangenotii]
MKSFFFELLIMIIFSYTITNLLILIYNDIKNSKVSFIKYVKLLFESVIMVFIALAMLDEKGILGLLLITQWFYRKKTNNSNKKINEDINKDINKDINEVEKITKNEEWNLLNYYEKIYKDILENKVEIYFDNSINIDLIDDELDRSISIFKSLDKIEINSKTVQSGRHHLVKANEYLIEVYKGILDGDKIESEEYFNRSKYYFENYIKLRYKNRRSIRKL